MVYMVSELQLFDSWWFVLLLRNFKRVASLYQSWFHFQSSLISTMANYWLHTIFSDLLIFLAIMRVFFANLLRAFFFFWWFLWYGISYQFWFSPVFCIQKGGDSIEKFLLRLKHIRDQLSATSIMPSDDDIIIVALNGLLPEFDNIKTVFFSYAWMSDLWEDRPHSLEQLSQVQLRIPKQFSSAILASYDR